MLEVKRCRSRGPVASKVFTTVGEGDIEWGRFFETIFEKRWVCNFSSDNDKNMLSN